MIITDFIFFFVSSFNFNLTLILFATSDVTSPKCYNGFSSIRILSAIISPTLNVGLIVII